MREEKQIQKYICPKCMTKVVVKDGERLPSMYCSNCIKTKQLSMLRMVRRRNMA